MRVLAISSSELGRGILGLLLALSACGPSSSTGDLGVPTDLAGAQNDLAQPAGTSDLAKPADLAGADLAGPPSLANFGQPCTGTSDASCGAGLFCLEGPYGGFFCTKDCPGPQATPCTGTPVGSKAVCFTNSGSGGFCAFLCQSASVTYPCPGTLVCSAAVCVPQAP